VVSQSGAPLGVVLVVLYNLGVVLVGDVFGEVWSSVHV
jgi:hypothetical protein